MRNLGLLTASIAGAALLVGCGGSGGGSSKQVTRTVAGFVYVLGNTGSANPNAVILPTATAPAGFFAPTAGTVTLSVPDGVISRSPDQEVFSMVASNAIICSVKAKENTLISVSGAGLQYQGNPRSFSAFSVSIGVKANSNTVLTLNTGSSVYTPGPAASLFYTIDGVVPTDPTQQFISGAPANSLAVVSLDASGVIVPLSNYNVTASNGGVVVAGSPGSGPFDLTPGDMTVAAGTVDVTIDDTNANLQAVINGNFTHGTATSVTVGTNNAAIWWNTTTSADAPATATITATVLNQYNVAMPAEPIALATDKIPSSGNAWSGADGTLTGNAFTTQSGVTDAAGQFSTTFSTPGNVDGPLTGTQKNPKGLNTVSGTSGSATGSTGVTILRPIGALTLVGPARLDVNTASPASGVGSYNVTGATDVDNDVVSIPAGSITWTLTNVAGAGTVGNTGDTSPQSTSSANNVANVVNAGNSAGQVTMVASIGTVNSNTITTEVYGAPSKVVYTPDTIATAIVGAAGEYPVGAPGTTIGFIFALHDSFGHNVTSESTWTSTSFIDSLTGGAITSGGSNVNSFTITAGPGDGTFRITANGNWTGTAGGSGTFNLQRVAGHNAP
jgi:hypothetical protein